MRTNKNFYMRKESNSHRICLEHQYGRRFIVLEHQYGRRDVMWKRSITISKYHSLYLCQISLQNMLLPILIYYCNRKRGLWIKHCTFSFFHSSLIILLLFFTILLHWVCVVSTLCEWNAWKKFTTTIKIWGKKRQVVFKSLPCGVIYAL